MINSFFLNNHLKLAGRRSPIAGRRSPVAGHLPRRLAGGIILTLWPITISVVEISAGLVARCALPAKNWRLLHYKRTVRS